jgi:hypothetical protein
VRTAPDLSFSSYFQDHNHSHNIDEEDVIDAYYGRRVSFSKLYMRNGKPRREVLARNDHAYMVIIVEPRVDAGVETWEVLSAFPADANDIKRARKSKIGDFID